VYGLCGAYSDITFLTNKEIAMRGEINMETRKATRGYGMLEDFLARKRAGMADNLILPAHRKGRIADIGCGNFPVFLMRTEFAEKYALDKIVSVRERELKEYGINFINCDIEAGGRLPFQNEYLDVVTMLAVFEHIEPGVLLHTLEEIYRVLKYGGMFIMTTPAFWTEGLLKVLAKINLVSPAEIEEHKDVYSPKKIYHLLTSTSFAADKIKHGYFEAFMNIWVTAEK
jgi:SAM-dependent methyltransferase